MFATTIRLLLVLALTLNAVAAPAALAVMSGKMAHTCCDETRDAKHDAQQAIAAAQQQQDAHHHCDEQVTHTPDSMQSDVTPDSTDHIPCCEDGSCECAWHMQTGAPLALDVIAAKPDTTAFNCASFRALNSRDESPPVRPPTA